MEYVANNENMNGDRTSNDSFLISETESSIQTELSNNRASCRYCPHTRARERAQKMKSHLAIKYKERVPREVRVKLCLDTYYDTKEVIDKAKETRANQLLIKWIVCSDILFSAFDNFFFEDYTKILNPSYDPSKRTILASSILDSEMTNIIIKVENKLSKTKNLTLYIDIWCSPLKQSIYTFVIITNKRKQNSYSASAALREKIIYTFTLGRNLKSTTKTQWLTQLQNILSSAKQAIKNVEFRTTALADIFVELVKMTIAIQVTFVLYNSQFWHD
ncbi:6077_t:CDS:2, partial [Cetraspora pellucida]